MSVSHGVFCQLDVLTLLSTGKDALVRDAHGRKVERFVD